MKMPKGAVLHDFGPTPLSFRDAVFLGLAKPQKTLPCQFFYDEKGSRLFQKICRLPEYYLTRTELGILGTMGPELHSLLGKNARMIEFGCGSSEKIITILKHMDIGSYVPVDISKSALMGLTHDVARQFPDLQIHAICADFTKEFEIPLPVTGDQQTIGFYPGSTIGNFTPDEAREFLAKTRALLSRDGLMIVGVDLQKSPEIIERAYNDSDGVTAEFNKNLLRRINQELNGSFELERFVHRSHYDAAEGRVEMHLESREEHEVQVDGASFSFLAGETIHTENSHKYTLEGFKKLAGDAGYSPLRFWTDAERLFSVHLLRSSG